MKQSPVDDLSTDVQTEVSDMSTYRLTANDRCSRCGAQAYVITLHEAGPLFWCGHHFHEHEDELAALKVLDERDTINN